MIEFQAVTKTFGRFRALDAVTGTIGRGEVITICGPSGSGKSTLVRTVNRLEEIDKGRVLVGGEDITTKTVDIDILRRRVGFVFQQYNLFPHLSARDNIVILLRRIQGLARREAEEKAMQHLARLGLEGFADRMPAKLSGGQQQRVAIARALCMNPDILLLDEPTSALDAEMSGEVMGLLRSLAGTGITIVCVTHEMRFARDTADFVWFMADGKLLQAAPPQEFFGGHAHPRAGAFLQSVLQS
ncbi:amino acid ABC transporter ATP-binding protein [Agrobacterium tumefaciens]|uniref:amino acid ABC transporter ATP-binding protein n=1 Tax=Agrobacterium tumefaciens TaxID=358 RepID=UPI00157307E9|nr:amino acid ABC transporter ATP-binding protein [Agrobacterium tumefaciens]